MKFAAALFALALAVPTLAQRIAIGAPAPGTTLARGSQFTVEVDRPNFLSSAQEVAIVISLLTCGSAPCPDPNDRLGPILYIGSYNPQYEQGAPEKPPHQNFTVSVPGALPSLGPAQLSVVHFSLIGAGPEPFLETQNVSVIVS